MPSPNMAKPEGPRVDPDATSDETLHDLKENESESEAGGTSSDTGPSPDGAFDEPDEIKDAEPG